MDDKEALARIQNEIEGFKKLNNELRLKISQNSEFISMLQQIERGLIKSINNQDSKQRSLIRTRGELSFQEMIRRILQNKPNGATAKEILDLIKQEFNLEVMRSSISPQLSRLKEKGEIELKSGVWKLISLPLFKED
jgi:hypothetical protein